MKWERFTLTCRCCGKEKPLPWFSKFGIWFLVRICKYSEQQIAVMFHQEAKKKGLR